MQFFQHLRKQFREEKQIEIQQGFDLRGSQELVFHWDGKLFLALAGIEKFDKLIIIVTFHGN